MIGMLIYSQLKEEVKKMSDLALITGLGLGVMLFCIVLIIAAYVLYGISHMKALKALGYRNAWLAWIPYGCYYACADAVSGNEEKVKLFDSFDIPAMIFKLWWVLLIVLDFIPLNDTAVSIIKFALNIVFLGCTYAKMYARLENKAEKDEQVLGCVSGFLPIIAVCKFLCIK